MSNISFAWFQRGIIIIGGFIIFLIEPNFYLWLPLMAVILWLSRKVYLKHKNLEYLLFNDWDEYFESLKRTKLEPSHNSPDKEKTFSSRDEENQLARKNNKPHQSDFVNDFTGIYFIDD